MPGQRIWFIETPYRKVDKENRRVTEEIVYLTADEEEDFVIAQANAPLDEEGRFTENRIKRAFTGYCGGPCGKSRLHGRVSQAGVQYSHRLNPVPGTQ
jgi:hypothetical protein